MDVALVGTAALALVFGAGAALARRLHHAITRLRGLRLAAEAAGLSQIEVGPRPLLSPAVIARSGRLVVRIRDERGDQHQVAVTSPGSDLEALTLRPEGLRASVEKQIGRPEIQIGDDFFDAAFFVHGPEPTVRARLHEPTRRLLLHLRGQTELTVAGGELRATILAPLKIGLDDPLSRLLPSLIELAHHLADPLDVPRRLAENTQRDPSSAARLHNLESLLEVTSAANACRREALSAACHDPDARVRLRAALERGPEGADTLLRLVDGGELPDEQRATAIAHLGTQLSLDRARAILERALSKDASKVAVAALGVVAEHGTPEAEALLIRALTWNLAGADVAAAHGLGRIGRAAAVLPLKEAAARDAGRTFRAAVQRAVEEIQSRLAGASPGQLSLTAGATGQLSVVGTEAGQLSAPESEQGGVSISDADEPTQ